MREYFLYPSKASVGRYLCQITHCISCWKKIADNRSTYILILNWFKCYFCYPVKSYKLKKVCIHRKIACVTWVTYSRVSRPKIGGCDDTNFHPQCSIQSTTNDRLSMQLMVFFMRKSGSNYTPPVIRFHMLSTICLCVRIYFELRTRIH